MKKRKCTNKEKIYSHTKNKYMKAGNYGEILGTRSINGFPEVLVKFKGYGCPISLKLSQIELK